MKTIIKIKNMTPVIVNDVKDIFTRTDLNHNKEKIFIQRDDNKGGLIYDLDDVRSILIRR